VIDFEGAPMRAFTDEPLAVSLFAAGVRTLGRSTKYHRPRGAFCFEGHCASCLVRVDGRPNVRACMTPVRPDLRCERQNAFPSAEVDLMEAADWMFPHGMDHHTLMTGNAAANRLFVNLVRQVGGSGTLPDAAPEAVPASRAQLTDVCIVGGGPAGLRAAATLGRLAPGTRIVLVDEQATLGGSWLAEPGGAALAQAAVSDALAAGVVVHRRAVALGFFPEDVEPILENAPDREAWLVGTLVVATPEGLLRISAKRILYATGGADQNVPFLDNDRPGVLSARACGRLAFLHGVRPGRRVAIVGNGPLGDCLAAGLAAAGVEVERIAEPDERPFAAVGGGDLRALDVLDRAERKRRVDADIIASAAIPAPASELPRQHGARVDFDEGGGGFAVQIDEVFRTSVPRVYACGDVAGYRGPMAAAEAGAAAGREIAQTVR
jgi:sarcosine oxidase subunit alpha